jgi:hypothetical protein
MLWIIASIPFWLVGAVILGVSWFALFKHLRANTMNPADALGAALILAFAAGIFFIIAAKVAGA